jgi:small-conductance mechanosensitive channel
LREAGIEIPSPQRDIRFRSGVLQVETVSRSKKKTDDAGLTSPDAGQPE